MFKNVQHIDDIRAAVSDKKEIKFYRHSNGITLGVYLFADKNTFDSVEALECRGIAFNEAGHVVSRPLHKFFNVGERDDARPEQLLKRNDIVAIFDKLDGSMLATAWINNQVVWRSKKTFDAEVVRLTEAFLQLPENKALNDFAHSVASTGHTAIFELTHPAARIVVPQEKAQLRLLHVRENVSGQYVMLDPAHAIHALIRQFNVPVVERFAGLDIPSMLATLQTLEEKEGFVVQFANGDMVKLKCPWYLRLHRAASLLRERDIAGYALDETLDDVKSALREMAIDLTEVEQVETRVKKKLLELETQVEAIYDEAKTLDQKSFAIQHKSHPLFGLLMSRYAGQTPRYADFYKRHGFKDDFTLRSLADEALTDALEE